MKTIIKVSALPLGIIGASVSLAFAQGATQTPAQTPYNDAPGSASQPIHSDHGPARGVREDQHNY